MSMPKCSLDFIQTFAERHGYKTFYSQKGDLIIKRTPIYAEASNYVPSGLEMFEKYEGQPLQKDELEHIITILIR